MQQKKRTTKTNSTMNNKGRKLIDQINGAGKKGATAQKKARKSTKKGTVTLLPSSIEIGPLQPLPGATGWLSRKIEIGDKVFKLSMARMQMGEGLATREETLLRGALEDAVEILKECEQTVADDSQPEESRLAAYEKAAKITIDSVRAKAGSIQADCLGAIERYLAEELPGPRYSETMNILDCLLYERGKTMPSAHDFEALTTELMHFLFIPEVGARFYKATRFKPEDVAKHMERLATFFKDLQRDNVEAEIEHYAITEVPGRYDFKALSWRRWDYEKQAAKSRATFQVDAQFDNIEY